MAESIRLGEQINKLIALTKQIERHTHCTSCNTGGESSDIQLISSGSGNIPAGFRFIKVIKTDGTGTVVLTMSDSSTYTLTASGDIFEIPATGGVFPAITISSSNGGTWQWVGVK
jgi:hypothetical protein